MSHAYTNYGLQPNDIRMAGQVAVGEHIIARLRDKVGKVQVLYRSATGTSRSEVDLTDRYSNEYPQIPMDLPFVIISFVSESSQRVGLGRVALSGDGTDIGYAKTAVFHIDVWGRKNLERNLIADYIIMCIHTSYGHFREVGIHDVRVLSTFSRNYEQDRISRFVKASQQATLVHRKVMVLEVTYDLITVVQDEWGELIQEIRFEDGISMLIGGKIDLILDRKFILKEQLAGVSLLW